MLAGGHQAQRLGIVAVGEGGNWQRRHGTLLQQVHALLRKLVRQHRVVAHHAVDVDRCKAQVLAEDAQAERVVGVDIDLADLAVPAARTQRLQTQGDVAAGEGVQYHIDTFAASRRHQFVVPVVAV